MRGYADLVLCDDCVSHIGVWWNQVEADNSGEDPHPWRRVRKRSVSREEQAWKVRRAGSAGNTGGTGGSG